MPSAAVLEARLGAGLRLRPLVLVQRIAEFGSLQRAAESMALSQSAATHALAGVETLLGVELFERHARGMRPTPAGMRLLPVVERMLRAARDLAGDSLALNRGALLVLRIAALPAAVPGVLAAALPAFNRRHPDVHVNVGEAGQTSLVQSMQAASVDFVLCRAGATVPPGWTFELLASDRGVVVALPDHPLATRRRVSLADTADAEWLLPPPGVATREAFDAHCAAKGFVARVCPISTLSTILGLAMMRRTPLLGVAPWQSVRGFVEAGVLRVLPLALPLELEALGMAWPASPSRPLAELVDAVRRAARQPPKA